LATETATQEIHLADNLLQELDNYIDELKINLQSERRRGYLIQILHKAQSLFGFLPEPLQLVISRKLNIPHSEISGVISFYNYFTATPKGKYRISVCMGTACFVKGGDKILEQFENFLDIKTGEVTPDGKYSIDALRCIGACGLAPVVMINDKVYGNVTTKQVGDIIEDCLLMEAQS